MINIIAAVSENNVIGINGKIPWKIPEDMENFRKLTTSQVVIMGRKTFESIGRPLADRINIVVSKNQKKDHGIFVADSLEKALEFGKTFQEREIFLCGGERIYAEGMNYADTLYITKVKGNYQGDAFFPEINSRIFSVENVKKIAENADLYIYKRK